jgi:hypothetical protein
VLQQRRHQRVGHVLNHLVTHARTTAHRVWLLKYCKKRLLNYFKAMNDRKEKRESSGWVCMNAGQYFDAFDTSTEMFNRDYLINITLQFLHLISTRHTMF